MTKAHDPKPRRQVLSDREQRLVRKLLDDYPDLTFADAVRMLSDAGLSNSRRLFARHVWRECGEPCH